MFRRWALGAVVVAVILGCGGEGPDVVAPPGPEVAVQPPVPADVPPAVPSDVPASVTAADFPADAKTIDAYVESCGHVFPANIDPQYSENDPSNECTWREFDQNCAPDAFGCWGKGEACRDACHQPCVDCQAACTGSCDTCKSGCNGDAACVRKCAETRANCRATCMTAHENCTHGPTCATVESECAEAGEKEKAAKCPNCSEIEQCITEGWNTTGADPTAACKAKYPANAEECWTWCGFLQ